MQSKLMGARLVESRSGTEFDSSSWGREETKPLRARPSLSQFEPNLATGMGELQYVDFIECYGRLRYNTPLASSSKRHPSEASLDS